MAMQIVECAVVLKRVSAMVQKPKHDIQMRCALYPNELGGIQVEEQWTWKEYRCGQMSE